MIRDSIKSKFPFETPREGQLEIINTVLNDFDSGKKLVLLQGPTGSGKSVIAYTIAKHYKSSYYLTATKILQSQLIGDFANDPFLVALKGRNAYQCGLWPMTLQAAAKDLIKLRPKLIAQLAKPQFNFNCDVGVCKVLHKKNALLECNPSSESSICGYYKQRALAMKAQICVMNFDSFLYQTSYTKGFFPRDLLVADEMHNIEEKLLDFVSIIISDKDIDLNLKPCSSPLKYVKYFESIGLKTHIMALLQKALDDDDLKTQEKLDRLLSKLALLDAVDDSWIHNFVDKGKYNVIELKPLFVGQYAHDLMFSMAGHTLMMSATILSPDIVMESLGIGKNDVSFYSLPSTFPKEHRPVYFTPCGSLSFKKKHETYPKLVKSVDEICNKYPDKKGIIHTHNFEISQLLLDQCENSKRFLFQKNFESKEEMLQAHANHTNSVLVGPALHEGLDLIDDLSRFQIICKVPYPNQNDNPQLKKRVELSWNYYIWLTAVKLVQSAGRSVRSKTDWADTYVLDYDFGRFVEMAADILPEWFVESIS